MRWHCPNSQAPRKKKGAAPSSSLFDTHTAAVKPRRRLQNTEAYICLYYKQRILERVRAEVGRVDGGPMINVIRKVAKELYDQEDDDTRNTVHTYIQEQAQAQLETLDLETLEPTPEQYQE